MKYPLKILIGKYIDKKGLLFLLLEWLLCGAIAFETRWFFGVMLGFIFFKQYLSDRRQVMLLDMQMHILDIIKLTDGEINRLTDKHKALNDKTFRMHTEITELIADLTIKKIDLSGDKIEKSLSSKN